MFFPWKVMPCSEKGGDLLCGLRVDPLSPKAVVPVVHVSLCMLFSPSEVIAKQWRRGECRNYS